MRTFDAMMNRIRRLQIAMGYIPNREWLRAGLNRHVAVDRAKAHLAIAELERVLRDGRDAKKCTNATGDPTSKRRW